MMDNDREITTEQFMEAIMDIQNYMDTFGIITLKNGVSFRVSNMFEYFREEWNDYLTAKKEDDEERLQEFYSRTGGILSNDELDVNVEEIAAMLGEYKMFEIKKEIEGENEDIQND